MTDAHINAFGDYFRGRRAALGLTLRAFALKNRFDAGNLSRLERGIISPPGRETLERYAEALDLRNGSDEWYKLFDLAAAQSGQAPIGISDEELVAKLPVFFRTLRGQQIAREDVKILDELIAVVKQQYS